MSLFSEEDARPIGASRRPNATPDRYKAALRDNEDIHLGIDRKKGEFSKVSMQNFVGNYKASFATSNDSN